MPKSKLVRQGNRLYRVSRKQLIDCCQAVIDGEEMEPGDMGEPVDCIDLAELTPDKAVALIAELQEEK